MASISQWKDETWMHPSTSSDIRDWGIFLVFADDKGATNVHTERKQES
jgi:hypothetical protein